MERNIHLTIILPVLLLSCIEKTPHAIISNAVVPEIPPRPASVALVPLPAGYKRINYPEGSFATWLRKISIKKDTTVYLYNGQPKKNQRAQYAVLNIPVGNKDLQQCADAVMRLRAMYLYSQKKYMEISFADNNGKRYTYPAGADSIRFEHYLEEVFSNCGTASLEKQLHPVADFGALQPGDVLIKGGYPGHCVIVMDMAVNKSGQVIYLLAQSYMPAQDIHLLKNPVDENLSPWYEVKTDNSFIYTPEWTFEPRQLRRW
ncbi:hypothetical protein A3860_10415 [Niastella vici]|uniref:DUF4846 domain-containing protein n=1 Tax=Niastella vici TaxID=1703345 RepID=A0A1V9FFB4_9BACT|nr:DUF4846 domain-containing protein [Niastella vici]OQP56977.1 hypothetical protein A3860_10415 [Niastella vici]